MCHHSPIMITSIGQYIVSYSATWWMERKCILSSLCMLCVIRVHYSSHIVAEIHSQSQYHLMDMLGFADQQQCEDPFIAACSFNYYYYYYYYYYYATLNLNLTP